MSSDYGTLGWLIRTTLKEARMSIDEFVDLHESEYGFSRSTVFRWQRNEGSANDLPYPIIEALTKVAKKSSAELFLKLGVDVFKVPDQATPMEVDVAQVLPLIKGNFYDSLALQEAVNLALQARKLYCHNGDLITVLRHYEDAAEMARDQQELLLASYIGTYIANLYEMTGRVTEAISILEEILEFSRGIRTEARKTGDELREWMGTRLTIEAKIRWLWTARWAAGITEDSLIDGREFTKVLRASRDSVSLPHHYIFMARCAVALNHIDEALYYLELAEARELARSNPQLAPTRLFLDVEPNQIGKQDFSWKEDQLFATKADILIAAGLVDEAFGSYTRIKRHRTPGAMLCLHNWFNPSWQELLKNQTLITDDVDPKLLYTFDEWEEELEDSGDLRVQALVTFSKGENDERQGDYLWAGFRYERARELAEKCGAEDIVVNAISSASLMAVKNKKRDLAIAKLDMLQDKKYLINNPISQMKYRQAIEAIRQL